MGDTQAAVTAALGEMERACAAIDRARNDLGGSRATPDVHYGLEEASHAAFLALVALRESYRALAGTPDPVVT